LCSIDISHGVGAGSELRARCTVGTVVQAGKYDVASNAGVLSSSNLKQLLSALEADGVYTLSARAGDSSNAVTTSVKAVSNI
jgi:hypothetical protein